MLNSIVWIAKGDVPEGGTKSKRPTVEEMFANHDEPLPADVDKRKEEVAKKIEELNKPFAPPAAAATK